MLRPVVAAKRDLPETRHEEDRVDAGSVWEKMRILLEECLPHVTAATEWLNLLLEEVSKKNASDATCSLSYDPSNELETVKDESLTQGKRVLGHRSLASSSTASSSFEDFLSQEKKPLKT